MKKKNTIIIKMTSLTAEQQQIYDKYCYANYVASLKHDNMKLTQDEILEVEEMTRGQSENFLWRLLRLNRQTASNNKGSNVMFSPNAAMCHGLKEEKKVKDNKNLMSEIQRTIEIALKTTVIQEIFDCGMFLSSFGLHAASPDAYYVTADMMYIPIEIKCPYTYKDLTYEDVRKTLRKNPNSKKERFRIKNTALSVNVEGSPLFIVEKTDPHYRQMQRQMYVMNAPICVYLVKFKDSYVATTVYRDSAFYNVELKEEKKIFNMFVNRNKRNLMLTDQYKRKESFEGKHLPQYTELDIRALTRSGLYFDFGQLVCIFCQNRFDVDTPAKEILAKHTNCASNSYNGIDFDVKHRAYINYSARLKTLSQEHKHLASDGLFLDPVDSQYKMFCCGLLIEDDFNINHVDDCEYSTIVNTK
uniref:Alkaline exonuclease n=1 Tax=Chrysodeixis includens nucleopolyhedrovirus TaxID=1207438 RepID=A0A1C8ZZF4_9ABAC|nr:alkaline exonuclease [Chrysodeixis includens nucleopolyhedrovirus]AOL57265.1 alkaline exonuclease [Chrysodeixis includens nucleopolyhedrovirus]QGW49253.1 alkaline exonuclease [Chrysodeixis includens nucleopolyhedrovirus]QGW49393.1 alkaline exonuclease [Chrysodeixis includens nucleopolyhedrovirus]QGW49533.1 alkaline exonuclease [Chrysodeixis includens nucleopolyhedrovirus]